MSLKQSSWLWAMLFVTTGAGGCASDQKHAPSAEDVANGEALPAAPPVPAQPASTDSPATAPAPVVNAAAAAPTSPSSAGAPNAGSAQPEALTEAQVALVAELANGAEVDQGKIAQGKAKSPAVKKFADMMVKHHSEAQQEQTKLFKKLNLIPADSPSATELKTDADKTTASLRSASPADFDSVYVAAQVDAHQKVLDALDNKLLPAARTAELKEGLRKMRTTVEAHLSQAKTLQSQSAK
jgi:putative membrane protein